MRFKKIDVKEERLPGFYTLFHKIDGIANRPSFQRVLMVEVGNTAINRIRRDFVFQAPLCQIFCISLRATGINAPKIMNDIAIIISPSIRQMNDAHSTNAIVRLPEKAKQTGQTPRVRPLVAIVTMILWILAGENRGTTGHTDRRLCNGILKSYALARELIQIGCFDVRMSF